MNPIAEDVIELINEFGFILRAVEGFFTGV